MKINNKDFMLAAIHPPPNHPDWDKLDYKRAKFKIMMVDDIVNDMMKTLKRSNKDPKTLYLEALCKEYNEKQSERSENAIVHIIIFQPYRKEEIFNLIDERFHEDLNNKIIANSL